MSPRLKSPSAHDPKWYVKRWMAVTCIRIMWWSVVWVLLLMTYVIMNEVKIPDLGDFAILLGLFAPCLASVPIKYYHDESKIDAIRAQKLPFKEPGEGDEP